MTRITRRQFVAAVLAGALAGLAAEVLILVARFGMDGVGITSGVAVIAVASSVAVIVHTERSPIRGVFGDMLLFVVIVLANALGLAALTLVRNPVWFSLSAVSFAWLTLVASLFGIGPFVGTLAGRRFLAPESRGSDR